MARTPQQLNLKLNKLQHGIREWAQERIGSVKQQILACRNYLQWIDKCKELRQIIRLERLVTAVIKERHTTLSVLEEDIWRQRARTKWELQGDRGTKYFHAIASGVKRSNTIAKIEHQGMLYSDQATKAKTFFNFFKELMGTPPPQMPNINWTNLYPSSNNLQSLAAPITSHEIEKAIKQWLNNKSPGPDGFPGEFYKHFLTVLLPDIHEVF